MPERKFKVFISSEVIAENLNIETALILVKGLFTEYFNDSTMEIRIREMERVEEYNA